MCSPGMTDHREADPRFNMIRTFPIWAYTINHRQMVDFRNRVPE
jgi:hypothetical protein